MKNKKNVVKWNFIFYFMEFLYTILIGIVLVPLYMAYIPKDLYGFWLATGNILSILTLINPGFSDVIQQKIAYCYGLHNYEKIGLYAVSGICLTLVFSLTILVIGIGINFFMGDIFTMKMSYLHELKIAFSLMLIGVFLIINYYSFSSILYAFLSSKSIGLIVLLGNSLSTLISIYLIIHGYGLIAIGVASVVRGGTFLLCSIICVILKFRGEQIRIAFSFNNIKEIFSFSIYNFLGKVGQALLTNMNSFLTAKFVSPIDAANLRFTQTGPEFGKILVLRFLYSVAPIIPNLLAAKGLEAIKVKLLNIMYFLISFIFLVCVGFYLLNEQFIYLWLGENNFSGKEINFIIVVLLFFSSINKVCFQFLFALGDMKKSNKILFYQSLLYLPIVIFTTKFCGIIGLLLSGILIELLALFVFFFPKMVDILDISKKDIKKRIFRELAKLFFVTVITLLVGSCIKFSDPTWLFFSVEIIIIVLTFFSLLYVCSKVFRKLFSIYK
jgi:putative LPS biosynthesis related flippase